MHNIDENQVLRDVLSGLYEEIPPMPENLHAAWMQKVEDDMEEKRTQKTRTFKTLTRWLSVAAAMVFVIGGTLLTGDSLYGGSDSLAFQSTTVSNADMKRTVDTATSMYGTAYANTYGLEYAEEDGAMMDMGAGDTVSGMMLTSSARSTGTDTAMAEKASVEKKIIRTANMTITTQTFEDSLRSLKDACTGFGGWIESASESVSSYTGLRTAYLTLRVPQSSLDAYLNGTSELGRITNKSESAQDVTESYQDTQTRLATQVALMARLQALITESADLSDLLELENQIADTQYQIDRLQSSLNSTDRQVSYSTVSITLKEERTVELTDTTVTFGERISSAIQVGWGRLIGFLSDMVVFLVAATPFIIIIMAVIIVIRMIIRRRK